MKDVLRYFAPQQGVTAALERLSTVCSCVHPLVEHIGGAFQANMKASLEVASCTSVVTLACLLKDRQTDRSSFEILSSIGSLPPLGSKARGQVEQQNAKKRLGKSEAERLRAALENLRAQSTLWSSSQDDEIHAFTDELLKQAIVLAWGAFEVVATDLMEAAFNEKPELVVENSPAMLEFFKTIRLKSTSLSGHSKPGTAIRKEKGLQSLFQIRAFSRALLKAPNWVHTPSAEQIAEVRHLIVHRRGIVDEKYLKVSKSTALVGEHLILSPIEMQHFLTDISLGGAELLGATSFFLWGTSLKGPAKS